MENLHTITTDFKSYSLRLLRSPKPIKYNKIMLIILKKNMMKNTYGMSLHFSNVGVPSKDKFCMDNFNASKNSLPEDSESNIHAFRTTQKNKTISGRNEDIP